MADSTTYRPSEPNPALRSLDRLVGAWNVTDPSAKGEIYGRVRFEWMEGGHFFIQHVDLDHNGHRVKGMEIIGYDEKTGNLKSHYFGSEPGILEYTWEVTPETLTIWFGDKGSEGAYRGRFSDDGNTCTGAWEWPGGGYEATMTRAG
jgi:hypothetical protein